MMSTLYGEPLLFKSKYVCNRSGSIQAPSSTTKVEDVCYHETSPVSSIDKCKFNLNP